jgi:hypothetical protein
LFIARSPASKQQHGKKVSDAIVDQEVGENVEVFSGTHTHNDTVTLVCMRGNKKERTKSFAGRFDSHHDGN